MGFSEATSSEALKQKGNVKDAAESILKKEQQMKNEEETETVVREKAQNENESYIEKYN